MRSSYPTGRLRKELSSASRHDTLASHVGGAAVVPGRVQDDSAKGLHARNARRIRNAGMRTYCEHDV
jgi:hypothetical protein